MCVGGNRKRRRRINTSIEKEKKEDNNNNNKLNVYRHTSTTKATAGDPRNRIEPVADKPSRILRLHVIHYYARRRYYDE